jgi:hypothetical protein
MVICYGELEGQRNETSIGDSEMPHPVSFLIAALIVVPAAAGPSPTQAAPRLGYAIENGAAAIIQVGKDRTRHYPGYHDRSGEHRRQGYFYYYNYDPHYSYSPDYSYSPGAYQYYYRYPRPGFVFQYCSSGVCFGF